VEVVVQQEIQELEQVVVLVVIENHQVQHRVVIQQVH
jgi:hypothetical protein